MVYRQCSGFNAPYYHKRCKIDGNETVENDRKDGGGEEQTGNPSDVLKQNFHW